MSPEDPGRLPFRQLMQDAHRQEREIEYRAELRAQLHDANHEEGENPARGVRGVLRRVRRVMRRF
jgi:hypothetical protein